MIIYGYLWIYIEDKCIYLYVNSTFHLSVYIVGEKWITTAWMREGVSEVDNWQIFDPSGVRILGS